jgi:hypothetical protein
MKSSSYVSQIRCYFSHILSLIVWLLHLHIYSLILLQLNWRRPQNLIFLRSILWARSLYRIWKVLDQKVGFKNLELSTSAIVRQEIGSFLIFPADFHDKRCSWPITYTTLLELSNQKNPLASNNHAIRLQKS